MTWKYISPLNYKPRSTNSSVKPGIRRGQLVEDALAVYVAEFGETREMLNGRYDDLKSGRVKPISRDELLGHFREKSAAARRMQPGEWPRS